MRFIKYLFVVGLSLLMVACPLWERESVDIGDYDNQLEAWNSQNMPDYKLRLGYNDKTYSSKKSKQAIVIVKNGIPESSDPPEWLTSGEKSTIPDFFSFLKEEKKSIMNTNNSLRLRADYNTVYHYPSYIDKTRGGNPNYSWYEQYWSWDIDLILIVENQQEAWNRLNILDYKLYMEYYDPRYKSTTLKTAIIIVKNGIPESSDPPEWLTSGEKSTIPDFFSFLKEEETRLEDYIFIPKDYVSVFYDPVYHYPKEITTGFRWCIDLMLPGDTE